MVFLALKETGRPVVETPGLGLARCGRPAHYEQVDRVRRPRESNPAHGTTRPPQGHRTILPAKGRGSTFSIPRVGSFVNRSLHPSMGHVRTPCEKSRASAMNVSPQALQVPVHSGPRILGPSFGYLTSQSLHEGPPEDPYAPDGVGPGGHQSMQSGGRCGSRSRGRASTPGTLRSPTERRRRRDGTGWSSPGGSSRLDVGRGCSPTRPG